MKKQSIELVKEFHEVFNHPIGVTPMLPDAGTVDFRVKFIKEELSELQEAFEKRDIVGMADGMGDIQYVLDGLFINCGLHEHKDAILAEIHRSNLSKTCSSIEEAEATVLDVKEKLGCECYIEPVGQYFIVKRKSDNKVMKSINYFKPNLEKILTE